MGHIDGKIYRLGLFLVILILFMVDPLFAQNTDQVGYNIRAPFYEDDKTLPTIILTADEARPVGVRVELKGVKLQWIGDKISEIKGIVTIPSAVYDESTLQVMGDKKIEYRSQSMDLDGVGFDIDQVKQIIHIRSKVKVILKDRLDPQRGKNRKLGKISFKKSTKGLVIKKIKKPESDKDNKIKEKKKEKNKNIFDWSSWFWLILICVLAFTVIKLLLKRKQKIDSGKSPRRKFF